MLLFVHRILLLLTLQKVITQLLVNRLNLPEAILNQWTVFERSQFVIQINCSLFVLVTPLLLFGLTLFPQMRQTEPLRLSRI